MRIHSTVEGAALTAALLVSLLPFTTATPTAAETPKWDCSAVKAGDAKFDLSSLKGTQSVVVTTDTPPTVTKMKWMIDICGPLEKIKDAKEDEQCPEGTQVCGIETVQHKDDKPIVHKVLPIAGNIGDRKLAAEVTRKAPSKSKDDPVAEGLQVILHGGEYNKVKQKVTIDFICDKERTGLEPEDGKSKREEKKEPSKASLQFNSYDEGTEVSTLKLTWLTKAACESKDAPGGGEGSDDSASWGFFTWFIIIAFLGTAAYLIFGSWLNYNRYGARGWDLLPHSDTIKDIPYLLRDWTRRVISTVQGGGMRGGYSAV